jgi:hypothetical protein
MFSPIDKYIDRKVIDEVQNDLESQNYPKNFQQDKDNLLDFVSLLQALNFVYQSNFKQLKEIRLGYIVDTMKILRNVKFLNQHSFETICKTLRFMIKLKNDHKNDNVIMARDFSITIHYLILYICKSMNAMNFETTKRLFKILCTDISLEVDCNLIQGTIRFLEGNILFL